MLEYFHHDASPPPLLVPGEPPDALSAELDDAAPGVGHAHVEIGDRAEGGGEEAAGGGRPEIALHCIAMANELAILVL